MNADLVMREQLELAEDIFAELVIWSLPRKLPGSDHHYKYRLALMKSEVCVLRFDNESGKGDHKHFGKRELPYIFTDIQSLLVDFWTDADEWLKKNSTP